jgi:hypothetical protein
MAGNLPSWPGASSVYSYLYKVLEELGAEWWSREVAAAKKKGRAPRPPFTVPEEMSDIIDALDEGDEETLKAIQMTYKTGY